MNVPIRLRRPLVLVGVALSLLVGAATIRAAAAWTAASSPLSVRPPSIEALQETLATEQARSAALRAQLDELSVGSAELKGALDAARERITSDATHAAELQASLEAAKAKLTALEKSIRQARTAAGGTPIRTATARSTAPTPSPEGEHEDQVESLDD